MTLREVSRDSLLAALGRPLTASVLDRCRAALVADGRASFATAAAPASVLLRSLEVKYRIARSSGREVEGAADLLLALHDLGDRPVAGVSSDVGLRHFSLYFQAWSLEPVGAVVVEEPAHGGDRPMQEAAR